MHSHHSKPRFGVKPALLAGAAVTCLAGLPQEASADTYCTTGGTGDIQLINCGTRVDAAANSGNTSLDVNGITLDNGNINYNPGSEAVGPLGMTLTVENSTINSTDYGGINMMSSLANTTVDVTLGSDVNITSTAGFGGLWVRNEVGGNITIDSGATIDATNADGLTATSNAGSVIITNTGNVTSHTNRGIYADGSPVAGQAVEVTVNNSGTVNAYEAGIRVIDYKGTAKIENSGDVTSTTKQALIAWTPDGDVEISNSGKLSAVAGTGLQGASQNGYVLVSNTNSIDAFQGIDAEAGFDTTESGSGDVTVGNSARITATGAEGIYAFSQQGAVKITNSGNVTGFTDGISAESWDGTVTIDNTGTVNGANGIRTGAAATTITNSGTIAGTDSAIDVGSGATTLIIKQGSVLTGDLTIGTGSLAIDPALDTSLSNTVAGGGTLIKQGAARLTLTGDSSAYTGDVNVTEGVLELTGKLGADRVDVGGENGASLEITGTQGASLTSSHGVIGHYEGETGDVTVSGAGNGWTSTGNIYVGNEGDGALSVLSGGNVASVDGYVGTVGSSHGEVTIDGEGSAWSMSGVFIAGYEAGTTADVTISNGGSLKAVQGTLGDYAGSSGSMTVTGAGSTWTAYVDDQIDYSGFMNVGLSGKGDLTVSDGGTVNAYRLYIGNDVGSKGTVTVTGEGSSITTEHRLYIGSEGSGTLTLSDGAKIKAERINIGYLAGASGVLNIGAAEGEGPVAAGTIQTAEGIYFGEGDATLVFNHTSDDLEFGNVMFGTGGEIRQLAGVTNLTADSPDYFGAIDVMGGLLKANGNLSGADVTVADGGTLGGAGTIGSLVVQDGGTLAPGNSPGTLTIAGDALFESGSVFNVEIAGAQHDAILVQTGDVTVKDGAVLHAILSGPLLDNPYPIIQLGEGSSGHIVIDGGGFVLVDDSLPLLEGVIGYGQNDVTLTYQGISTPWSALVATANQGAAANAVQALGSGNALYTAAAFLQQGALPGAFDSLSGEIHASLKSALIEDSRLLRSVAMDRAADLETGTGLWATGFGNWGSTDGNSNAASLDRNTAGVFIGVDRLFGNWRVGLLGGYSNTDFSVDARASSGNSDNYHLGLYAGGALGPLQLRAAVSHSWHDVSTKRNVTLAGAQSLAADYNAGTTQVFGELGYKLGAAGFDIEPFAGLAYVSLKTDDYAETGGVAALTGKGMTSNVTYSTLGLHGSTGVGGLADGARISGTLAWQHAFGDRLPLAVHSFGSGATPFTVSGVPIAEDTALAEIKLEVSLSENIRLNVGYKGQFGSGTTDNSALGGLSVRF